MTIPVCLLVATATTLVFVVVEEKKKPFPPRLYTFPTAVAHLFPQFPFRLAMLLLLQRVNARKRGEMQCWTSWLSGVSGDQSDQIGGEY